jgi:glucan phosphoethanolaminetransferase (alkaline phosphatase superfamily)
LIDSISVKWLMLYVLIISVITASLFWRRRTPAMRVDTTLLAFGTITFLGLASMSVKAMRVPEFVNHAAHTYRQQLITFRQMQKKRRNGQIAVKASKQHSGETYVVIIGESLNRRHMGLYGYFRNTTPKLDNLTRDGHLIVYDNVYSNYVNTMPALSYALTQASQYNHKNYYDAESIIDVARAAHFKSFWLSNQNLLGVWDNAVSVLAHSADTLVGINHSIGKTTRTQNFDGGLLRYVKRALDTDTHGNNIIFVHLMGSHFSYCKRFPKKYDIFHKTPTTAMMGSIVHDDKKLERRVNCYDNSVAYNDFVVSRIISLLRAHGGVSALTYFSDHADDVMGQLFHNASKFNFDMTAIPLMFWTSPGYAQRYPDKVKALRAHKNRLFTNDLVFNTVLGLAGIDTHYDKHGDLTSASYNLSSDRSRTLHGRKKITDDSDYIWWEHHNHALLTDKHLAKRVLPNHANTLGKLHQVWAGGYRSFAVDAWLTSAHHKSILRLGRKSSPAGTSLSAALVSIDTRHLDTLVINLRNLSAHNQDKVRAALDTLDARVGLKQRASLVTAAAPAVVTALRRDSWNVARRLPSAAIKSAIASGGKAPLTRLARKIARHVKTGNASGIAFEAGDYVFVKKYLATRLPDDLAWHVSTGFAFGKGELVGQLHKSSLPADQRVQTITGAYHSPFQL